MDAIEKSPLPRLWLLLGVAGLAVGGLLALPLAVAHTPAFATPAMARFFHSALVVHVDLTVLVWFLTIACMIWSVEAGKCRPWIRIPLLEEAALISMAAGALALTLSPLFGGEALMSNYIPVIAGPLFLLGLSLILCGMALMLCNVLLRRPPGESITGFGAYTAALSALLALSAFIWAYRRMPGVIEGQQYFDMLFWAGGHVLQFVHVQMMMIAWVLLAAALLPRFAPPRWLLLTLFSIGPLMALASPLAFVKYDVVSQEFRLFFTRGMIEAGGIAPAIMGLMIGLELVSAHRSLPTRGRVRVGADIRSGNAPLLTSPLQGEGNVRALASALIMSLLLFAYGGVIGMAIHGEDVTIPAHYHGSIVGITLAFMGLAYLWLPRFGYADVAGTKLAFWQPIVYGGGQILHISGFAWSGGYGVLRKTPGALEGGFSAAKAAMGLMELGGLLAIIGGLLFVVVVAKSVYNSSKLPSAK